MNSPHLGILCRGERVGLSESFGISHYKLLLTGKKCILYLPIYILHPVVTVREAASRFIKAMLWQMFRLWAGLVSPTEKSAIAHKP